MIKISLFAIFAALGIMLIKREHPQIAAACAMAAGAMLLLSLVESIRQVVDSMSDIAQAAGVGQEYLILALKLLGVSYACEFGAQICRDAGESSLAQKVELAGRVMLTAMAVPVMVSILSLVKDMMP